MHASGSTRLRPVDMLDHSNPNLTVLTGRCESLVWDGEHFEEPGRERVSGVTVVIQDGVCGLAERKVDVLANRE